MFYSCKYGSMHVYDGISEYYFINSSFYISLYSQIKLEKARAVKVSPYTISYLKTNSPIWYLLTKTPIFS